ncbi:protein tyrosine kinase [Dictyocaulus viviparus]|uniref:Protein tyrosine kinase n=1 Tax=Dictyocaulus viviparus TaxID=29172 RepID=A0A0D8X7K0_DICVI|nr:protein tyrosine kinase [Dictyocaulus viviparus]
MFFFQIKLMEVIGEGTFSIVKRAIWHNPNGNKTDVAVKILRDVSESIMEDLQVEASHLLKLQHYNLVRLYGIVQQPAMMVFELCDGGELLSRLRDKKKPVPLVTTLLDYCVQLVKALTFLESKHYVHRDVAARNILLSKDEKVVKLCDFGLMRSLKENERTYVMHARNRVPFSWCPPEALRYRQFSHASDVWAFGVTAWEIFSYGEDPWIGCRAIDVYLMVLAIQEFYLH